MTNSIKETTKVLKSAFAAKYPDAISINARKNASGQTNFSIKNYRGVTFQLGIWITTDNEVKFGMNAERQDILCAKEALLAA
jgi:hypothetical protein